MKKVLLMSFFAIALMFSANAQEASKAGKGPKRSATERAEALTKRMEKKLGLDAAQLERVKTINLESAKRIDEVRATMKDNRKDGREKIKAIEMERETTFKQILKEEQMKTYLEMRKNKTQKMMKKGGKNKAAAEAVEDIDE